MLKGFILVSAWNFLDVFDFEAMLFATLVKRFLPAPGFKHHSAKTFSQELQLIVFINPKNIY